MKRASNGFTLMELLVTLAIAGVLATVAVPNMSGFLASMRAKDVSFELVSDLTIARSEALKRNTEVTLKAKSGAWVNGWQVLDGATVLVEHAALPANTSIVHSDADVEIKFNATGNVTGAAGNQTFAITSTTSGVSPRCIRMTPTGAARAKPGAC